jgi:hypothetical protein
MRIAGTLFLLIGSLTSNSCADIIFSTFGVDDSFGGNGLGAIQGESAGTSGNFDQAASFTIGASNAYLTSIALGIAVEEATNNGNGAGPVDVILAADDGGLPGATLLTLPVNVDTVGYQVIFAAVSAWPTILSADTTYWVVADGKSTFNGTWGYSRKVGPTAQRFNDGNWRLNPTIGDRAYPPGASYAFRIEGRLVPEPATYVTFAAALGALLMCVRQPRNKKGSERFIENSIAVGTAVAGGPPHRSVREALPHTAPTLSRARNRWSGYGCRMRGRGRWRRTSCCIRCQVQRER